MGNVPLPNSVTKHFKKKYLIACDVGHCKIFDCKTHGMDEFL